MRKPPGLDEVYAWMVVLGGAAGHGALLALYQKVWCSQTGNLPTPWNEARISYLHKKRSKTEVSNYRPITLMSVLDKAFTKTCAGKLQGIAADHQVLVKEPGCGPACGQKEQGAPEHLWAFMDLMEELVIGCQRGRQMGRGTPQGHMPVLQMLQKHMIRCGGMASILPCTQWGSGVPCGTLYMSG